MYVFVELEISFNFFQFDLELTFSVLFLKTQWTQAAMAI